MISLICGIYKEKEKKKKAHRYREETGGSRGGGLGMGKMGGWGQKVQTSGYKMKKPWGGTAAR